MKTQDFVYATFGKVEKGVRVFTGRFGDWTEWYGYAEHRAASRYLKKIGVPQSKESPQSIQFPLMTQKQVHETPIRGEDAARRLPAFTAKTEEKLAPIVSEESFWDFVLSDPPVAPFMSDGHAYLSQLPALVLARNVSPPEALAQLDKKYDGPKVLGFVRDRILPKLLEGG